MMPAVVASALIARMSVEPGTTVPYRNGFRKREKEHRKERQLRMLAHKVDQAFKAAIRS
jgi:hypothetical protein